MSFKIVQGTLAADVANAGTFAVSYPTGTMLGSFTGAVGHKLNINQVNLSSPVSFSVAPGASTVVITNSSGATWAGGSAFILQLELMGLDPFVDPAGFAPANTVAGRVLFVSLGSPAVNDADGICASQSVTAATQALVNGAVGATFDVPRNIVGAWTVTSVLTVKGTDAYGAALTESSASGTSFTGKKAFKTVTSILFSISVTSATVGTGNVLGLPLFLSEAALILAESQDGAAATAGTPVAGINTAGGSTATTGDIRGTYTPNATPDGTKSFQLVIAAPDAGYRGTAQYSA